MSKLCVALVVAYTGFQPVEYNHTKKELEKAGIKVIALSNKIGSATATDGTQISVGATIQDFNMKSCDGIFAIGGGGAIESLNTPTVKEKFTQAKKLDKAYGAICIAPRILLEAGLLKDKSITGWNGDSALPGLAKHYGANVQEKSVVQDGNCITANGPQAAQEFGKTIATYLTNKQK